MERVSISPGLSELASIGKDLMDQVCKAMPSIFKGYKCESRAYNLKRIAIDTITEDGTAVSGHFEWSVTLAHPSTFATKDAYVFVAFDGDTIYLPPLFRDSIGRTYGINESAIDNFLRAKANLTDHDEPIRPVK